MTIVYIGIFALFCVLLFMGLATIPTCPKERQRMGIRLPGDPS